MPWGAGELDRARRLGVYLTVAQAAAKMGISTRRIRALLAQRRLLGEQFDLNGRQVWLVNHPFRITLGKRGPRLGTWSDPRGNVQAAGTDTV